MRSFCATLALTILLVLPAKAWENMTMLVIFPHSKLSLRHPSPSFFLSLRRSCAEDEACLKLVELIQRLSTETLKSTFKADEAAGKGRRDEVSSLSKEAERLDTEIKTGYAILYQRYPATVEPVLRLDEQRRNIWR